MTTKRLKRPRDPVQLAKLIGDIATGQTKDTTDDGRNQSAVERGRLGGKKGGLSRAQKLTPKQRQEAAQKAAKSRWARAKDKKPT